MINRVMIKKMGENNLMTLKQQLLGKILCFFMHLKWPWLLLFCENAVEAYSSISMILSLNCFYSIFTKKRNSHGHFKCINKHKVLPRSCSLSAIMLFSPKYFI